MLYAEVVTKFIVCVYEALWTLSGIEQPGGATPGKICMKLRVLHAEAIVSLPPAVQPAPAGGLRQAPHRVIIFPAQNMGFQRALLRALVKNLLMTLVFPLCFIMYPNNRTSYDVATRTVVVETPGVRQPARRAL